MRIGIDLSFIRPDHKNGGTEAVMKKISSLDTPPNIVGICKMIPESKLGNKILILEYYIIGQAL